jgi:hypothetical protein
METLRQDLRYAFRTLLKSRGLTIVAVISSVSARFRGFATPVSPIICRSGR